MRKPLMSFMMAFGLSIWLSPGFVYAGDGDAILRGLQELLRPSHMEVANPALEGYVFKPGAVVVLQAESGRPTRNRPASTCPTTRRSPLVAIDHSRWALATSPSSRAPDW